MNKMAVEYKEFTPSKRVNIQLRDHIAQFARTSLMRDNAGSLNVMIREEATHLCFMYSREWTLDKREIMDAIWEEYNKMNKTAKTYSEIVSDPVVNKRLWHEIENVVQQVLWMEGESGVVSGNTVKMKARQLAQKYGDGSDRFLSALIEENIWEEYHNTDNTTFQASRVGGYPFEDEEVVECPSCGAKYNKSEILLGGLGNREHFRCRDCGAQWSRIRSSVKKGNEMNELKVASELLFLAREVVGMDFPTQDAMDKYMKEYPDADRSNHKVIKKEQKSISEKHPFKPKDPKNPTDEGVDKHNKELSDAVKKKSPSRTDENEIHHDIADGIEGKLKKHFPSNVKVDLSIPKMQFDVSPDTKDLKQKYRKDNEKPRRYYVTVTERMNKPFVEMNVDHQNGESTHVSGKAFDKSPTSEQVLDWIKETLDKDVKKRYTWE